MMFGRKPKLRMSWSCETGAIGTAEFIRNEVKKCNKEMKRNKMHKYVIARVQPLPCGMAQMLVWHGTVAREIY